MKMLIYFSIIFNLLFILDIIPQSNGNIPLMFKGKFNRAGGVADVWGIQIGGVNYALVTLDDGLSIVKTDDPYNPCEIAHINHENYPVEKLGIPDVETFTYGGTTYAYLATNSNDPYDPREPYPLVMIINLNAALVPPQPPPPPCTAYEILIDPDAPSPSGVYVGKIDDIAEIEQSHTLTIAGNYLYVATMNDSLPVWDLSTSPVNPSFLGFVTLNPLDSRIHEMYVKSLSSLSARIYIAAINGGLQVLELSYLPTKGGLPSIIVNTRIENLYDFDKAFPNSFNSGDPLFNYRATHSAWPTNDGQYIFTTDELLVWPPSSQQQYSAQDQNLYTPPNVLKSPRREGTFLRVWDASLLGQGSSYKGGYSVLEEQPWGITDLSQIDTVMIPNSIHQMFARWNYLYVAHYTQGFRMLDISDPENIIEVGFYDDFPMINFNGGSMFFRQNWFKGIYGVFPDPNRSTVCYAGGYDGFYIFDVTPPPHPPINLNITSSSGNHPYLQWGFNGDENNIDHYNIYKKSNSSGYQLFDDTQSKFYEDLSETILTGGGTGHTVRYYVTAVSVSDYESNASDRVQIDVNGIPVEEKRNEGGDPKEQDEVFEYSLSDNYPNPFNPTTQINFSIERLGLVTLKIYDILGTEVATLVNEMKEKGDHSVVFNASDLPSGVYVYKLTSGNYVATKKLLLLK